MNDSFPPVSLSGMAASAVDPPADIMRIQDRNDSIYDDMHAMQKRGEQCDLLLKCTDEDGSETEIPVHRLVLHLRCTFFRTMFGSGHSDSTSSQISLPFHPIALALIVQYLYGAALDITDDNVRGLLYCASYLLLDHLEDSCCRFLASSLCLESAFESLELARRHSHPKLKTAALMFIRAHFQQLLDVGAHLAIPANALAEILGDDSLRVPEKDVYTAIISWVRHDEPARTGELLRLLRSIRFGLLPVSFLTDTVCKEDAIIAETECRLYLNEVLASLGLPPLTSECPTETALSLSPLLLSPTLERTALSWSIGGHTWITLPPMPPLPRGHRVEYGSAAGGGLLYVSGGLEMCNRRGHDWEMMCSHYVLDLYGGGEWRRGADLRDAVYGVGMAAIGHKAYLLGGHRRSIDQERPSSTVLIYDARADRWCEAGAMLVQRGGMGISTTVHDGAVYITGGTRVRRGSDPSYSRVDMWDPRTPLWQSLPAMPILRFDPQLVAHGDCIWAMLGGGNESHWGELEPHDLPSLFDLRAGRWRLGDALPIAATSGDERATSCDGQVVIAGGRIYNHDGTASQPTGAVWIYKSGEWREGAALETPRSLDSLLAADSIAFAMGGYLSDENDDSHWNAVEALCID